MRDWQMHTAQWCPGKNFWRTGGVGAKRNPPLWMKAGDVVEVEVERVGILRNPVADEA